MLTPAAGAGSSWQCVPLPPCVCRLAEHRQLADSVSPAVLPAASGGVQLPCRPGRLLLCALPRALQGRCLQVFAEKGACDKDVLINILLTVSTGSCCPLRVGGRPGC